MSTQFILLFVLQPLQIIVIILLWRIFPKVKSFGNNFNNFFWNGFITVLNGSTQTSLICALITIVFFNKNEGTSSATLVGPVVSLISSYVVIITLAIVPIVLVVAYKWKGPKPNNDSMIAGFELDRLGLDVCIMFYLIDYIS